MNIKKFTLYLLAVPILLTGPDAMAQSTVPGSAFPAAGDVFILSLADTTGVQPGASGANMTWNFSTINPNTHVQTDSFLAPSTTRYSALFSNADIAEHEINTTTGTNYFIYYHKDAANSIYQRVGNVQPDTVIYSDPANEFPYPLTYNSTFSDTYYAQFQRGGLVVHQHGTVSELVDGYGTLTTPAGTYNNVIRTHATRSELDTGFSTINLAFDQKFEYYNWYQPNSYFPIMTIAYSVRHLQGTFYTKSVGYRQGYATGPAGVADMKADDNAVMLFPNPAASMATIIYNAASAGETVISIYDMTGRTLQSHNAETDAGVQTYTLDISALPTGLYDVRIVNAGAVSGKKLQVIR